MIIVRLNGGLGNQLFQYAAARRLAFKLNTELGLDISAFKNNVSRKYELGAFQTEKGLADKKQIRILKFGSKTLAERLRNRICGKPPEPASTYIKEKHYHFDHSILTLPDGVYLEGYWQSEKYFSDIAHIIRNEVRLKADPVGKNREMAEIIAERNSVSLHVRRGDYVKSGQGNIHGTCGFDYYREGNRYITEKVANPTFFVFSDEPEWVLQNLKLTHQMIVVDHNGPQMAVEDLRLLSMCKHHIIANSSFSWWGAWLGSDPEKIVVCPRKWFADVGYDTRDLIPDHWTRL